jgi:hypothetical protein
MHEKRFYSGSAVDNLGRIYAIGGQNTVDLRTVERYDPDPVRNPLHLWEYVANLPDPYGSGPAAFSWGGDIWVVGGWDNGLTNNVRIFDPDYPDPMSPNAWRYGPPMYEGLVSAEGLIDPVSGNPFVFGGQRSGGGPGSDHVATLVSEPGTQVIPEPVTLVGVVCGLGAVAGYIRRRGTKGN